MDERMFIRNASKAVRQPELAIRQLTAKGNSWRAYMEDMGNDPTSESAVCGHPVLNTVDHTQIAEAPSPSVPLGDQYASRHNPFVYFHSIIDSAECSNLNLNLLSTDLASERTTPDFVFITPNLCNDGHDSPCVTGQPGGLRRLPQVASPCNF
jgi:phosphatidylinositol-3-phosphatase